MANTNELETIFKYHPPMVGQHEKYERLRGTGKFLAEQVVCLCPESRERGISIQKIEEAVMWANAAIARNT